MGSFSLLISTRDGLHLFYKKQKKETLPYLIALENIQKVFDILDGKKSLMKIHSITQHSPEWFTLEGFTRAIEFVVSRVDPLRKELAELNKKSIDAEIYLKNAQAASIILDNQKKLVELGKERIKALTEFVDSHEDKLTDDLRDQFREAIANIVASNLQIELKGISSSQNNFEKYIH